MPWGFGVFKVPGGARAYFHGGLSLPEMAVPVVVLAPTTGAAGATSSDIAWTIMLGSRKISARFCSVQISGQGTGLFAITPPRVRVEIRARKDVISQPVAASYGFIEATGDVQLRLKEGESRAIEPDTVTLMITQEIPQPALVSLSLLDAVTGRELKRLDKVEMAISI